VLDECLQHHYCIASTTKLVTHKGIDGRQIITANTAAAASMTGHIDKSGIALQLAQRYASPMAVSAFK